MTKRCERYGCNREAVIKFCSQDCKIAYHNAARDRSSNVKGKCASCGIEFIGRANKRTCSNVCRQRLYQSKVVLAKKAKPGKVPTTGVEAPLDAIGGKLRREHVNRPEGSQERSEAAKAAKK